MESRLKWLAVSTDGPAVAHATACVIGKSLYLHGGITSSAQIKPLSLFYKFSEAGAAWEKIEAVGSPSLSHHASLALDNRYMLLIGGWNGKERTSKLFAFDTQECRWIMIESSGFPVGAGLSSHTATLLPSGDIIVVGREGGLRTQRRSGNAFLLSGSVTMRRMLYKEYPLGVASRSGHSADLLSAALVIIGGRADKLVEIHHIPSLPKVPVTNLIAHIFPKDKQSIIPSMTKPPGGRKHHSTTVAGDILFMFGGLNFDGRVRELVSNLYVLELAGLTWKHLGAMNIGRAGHISCVVHDSVYLHGGFGEKNCVTNGTYKLTAT